MRYPGGSDGSTGELVAYTNNITTSNLESKARVSYTFGDSDHAHAVTSQSNGNAFS